MKNSEKNSTINVLESKITAPKSIYVEENSILVKLDGVQITWCDTTKKYILLQNSSIASKPIFEN